MVIADLLEDIRTSKIKEREMERLISGKGKHTHEHVVFTVIDGKKATPET